MYKRNSQGWLKHLDFILLDALVLQIAFLLAYAIRQGNVPYASGIYRVFAVLLFVFDIFIASVFNTMHNVLKRGYYSEFTESFKHVMLVLSCMVIYMFSVQMGDAYSRITVYLTALFHLILGYSVRLIWKNFIQRTGKHRHKASMILVADEKVIPEVMAKVNPLDDVEYSGVVLSNRDAEGEIISGLKVVANLSSAADYICREWVDEIFIYPEQLSDIGEKSYENIENFFDDAYGSNDSEEKATVATLIEQCRQMAIPIHIRLPLTDIGGKSFVEKVGGYNVLTTTINYASPLQLAVKRTIDILGGIVGSFFALLIIAIVGPMIKRESPGPILFKQVRIGQNGKKFKIYKIRSMYMDAEERKKELLKDNRVSDGMMFKMDFDPRIIGNKILPDGTQKTGIGNFIRRYSIDEFPQFFNVLFGQMSLVGTRPPTVDEWDKYKYHHRARLATRPGITGMWQVSGRSTITDFEEVVKLDTEYINNWSIGLDIKILIKTVRAVFAKDGAM